MAVGSSTTLSLGFQLHGILQKLIDSFENQLVLRELWENIN